MIKRPHGYSLRAIRNLLKTAFDTTQLDALCLDYYYDVFQEFNSQMRTDIKINLLFVHCLKLPTGLDDLLKIVQNKDPHVFARFEPDLKPPKEEVPNTDEYQELAETIELLDQLTEWKNVHENIQSILDKLGPVITDLKQSQNYEINFKLLDKASYAFQRDCATGLRDFHRKNFYYARTLVLNSLRKRFESMDEKIALMMGDISQIQLYEIYLYFISLKDELWDALTEADHKIKSIVIRLGKTIEV